MKKLIIKVDPIYTDDEFLTMADNIISNIRESVEDKLSYRVFSIDMERGVPATLDEEKRSVEVVGATETPAEIFDWNRGIIKEILLIDGLEFPKNKQVPLLDTHKRWDTSSVLGSYRNMKRSDGQLLGKVYFSKAPEAEGPFTKLKEGHLTDFSVGYRQLKSEWVPDGESTNIRGRNFKGPVLITSKARIKELSITPIGADELAKARSNFELNNKETNAMNEQLRKFLESKGLAQDATEEQAWSFLKRLDIPKEVKIDDPLPKNEKKPEKIDVEKLRAEAAGDERDRIREIDAMCATFGYPDMSDDMVRDGITLDDARKKLIAKMAEDKKIEGADGHGFRGDVLIQKDERDKFRAAAEDSLLIRAMNWNGIDYAPEKLAEGAQDLTGYTLKELARHALVLARKPTKGNAMEMVGRALVTSDLPLIMANVANKALFTGFETAAETWMVWCGTGPVSDFKTHYSPRISESDDLEEVPEHGEYQYGTRAEAQETYSIVTYGKIFAITRQAVINDDLGALTRIPASHGEAAARIVGDVAYAVLTANAAMGDAVALFHADHSNFVAGGSGAAPGIVTIAAGILAMGTQTDIKGLRRLNIRPEFAIMPKALEGAAEVFFRSNRFTDVDTIATDSTPASTQVNPYSGEYFTRVYEPRLDDNDAAAWFLAGPRGKTVTLFFLNGQQTPFLDTRDGWTVDGIEYKVRIDCGAKALDWRALYMNNGN